MMCPIVANVDLIDLDDPFFSATNHFHAANGFRHCCCGHLASGSSHFLMHRRQLNLDRIFLHPIAANRKEFILKEFLLNI